jgi:hypothetical protein
MMKVLPLAMVAARVPGVLKLLNSERVQISVFGLMHRLGDWGSNAIRGMRRK